MRRAREEVASLKRETFAQHSTLVSSVKEIIPEIVGITSKIPTILQIFRITEEIFLPCVRYNNYVDRLLAHVFELKRNTTT